MIQALFRFGFGRRAGTTLGMTLVEGPMVFSVRRISLKVTRAAEALLFLLHGILQRATRLGRP